MNLGRINRIRAAARRHLQLAILFIAKLRDTFIPPMMSSSSSSGACVPKTRAYGFASPQQPNRRSACNVGAGRNRSRSFSTSKLDCSLRMGDRLVALAMRRARGTGGRHEDQRKEARAAQHSHGRRRVTMQLDLRKAGRNHPTTTTLLAQGRKKE